MQSSCMLEGKMLLTIIMSFRRDYKKMQQIFIRKETPVLTSATFKKVTELRNFSENINDYDNFNYFMYMDSSFYCLCKVKVNQNFYHYLPPQFVIHFCYIFPLNFQKFID